MKIVLGNREDIERAISQSSWLNRPTFDQVTVLLPWLNEEQQTRAAKKIKFLFNDCGCMWGGPVFLIVFSVIFFGKISEKGFAWPILGVSFLIGAAAAISAKFLGLAWSCWRLKAWLNKIRNTDSRE
jgi:hypothetical protein